jgi:hypothetical protein
MIKALMIASALTALSLTVASTSNAAERVKNRSPQGDACRAAAGGGFTADDWNNRTVPEPKATKYRNCMAQAQAKADKAK